MSDEMFLLHPVTEGFLAYLKDVRRLAPGTLRDMRCTYRKAGVDLRPIRAGFEPWELSLDDFLRWIERSRRLGKSVLSISKEISHLRSLIDYAWQMGKTERNVLDGFKLKDQDVKALIPPKSLSIEQARALIEACERKSPKQKRERVMILLLYGCGLRTSELCKLNVSDIDLDRQELFIQSSKGEIQRRIPVPDGVWIELLAYLAEIKRKRGALFLTEVKKARIRQHDVLGAVHQAGQAAGIEQEVMPKMLRHSFATHLMDAGVDLTVIASLMGHRSPQESGVYLHALPGRKEAAVRKLNREEITPKAVKESES